VAHAIWLLIELSAGSHRAWRGLSLPGYSPTHLSSADSRWLK